MLNAEDYQIYRVTDRNKKNHKTRTTTKIGKNKPKTEAHKTKWETQNRKTLPENRNTNPKTEISIPNRKHTQRKYKIKPQN